MRRDCLWLIVDSLGLVVHWCIRAVLCCAVLWSVMLLYWYRIVLAVLCWLCECSTSETGALMLYYSKLRKHA